MQGQREDTVTPAWAATATQPQQTPTGMVSGRVALVTGGTRGIGAAICHRLAAEGASIAARYWRQREGAEKFQASMLAEFPDRLCTLHEGNIGLADDCRRQAYLHWCGAPESHLAELVQSRQHVGQMSPMVRAERLIEHGDLIDVPGLRLRAVWTPGHTPGHLCFHDETHDLLLTGDHILPRITPNISSYDLVSNPLADYLSSVEKLRGIQPREVLPAHEYRFADLDSRLDDLAEHHRERLAETEKILADAGPSGLAAWQVATGVTWSRAWAELASFQRQAAVGEVLSHLRQLQARGLVAESDVDGVGRWSVLPAQPAARL